MTNIASTHYSHNPAPPTTRSDGFLWVTTSSCRCNTHRSSSNSSSTCCCNTRCCYQGKNVLLPASPRRQGVSSVHPQRYQGFDPTFTQDKASHYIIRPRRFARKMHRTNVAVFGGSRPRHTRKSRSCSSSTPHLMGHGPGRPVKTRRRPHGHGGRHSSSSTVHRITWAAVRAGRSKHMGRLMGRAERPI